MAMQEYCNWVNNKSLAKNSALTLLLSYGAAFAHVRIFNSLMEPGLMSQLFVMWVIGSLD